jgi:riboflavin synthase
MFTGIVESTGVVARIERVGGRGLRFEVYAPEFGRDMAMGDSIAVDGTCLTVTKFIRGAFLADVSAETAERTTLGMITQGSPVNLERALRLSDRLGGHMMSGHVDGMGEIAMRQPAGNSVMYTFKAPGTVLPYIAPKGSVAVDGISLTVAKVTPDGFMAAIIPHTEEITTLGKKPIGAPVNMEADMLAKYVRRFVAFYTGQEMPEEEEPAEPRRGLGDMLKDLTDR